MGSVVQMAGLPRRLITLALVLSVLLSSAFGQNCNPLPAPTYGYNDPGPPTCDQPVTANSGYCYQYCNAGNFRKTGGVNLQRCGQGAYTTVALTCIPTCVDLTTSLPTGASVDTGTGVKCTSTDYATSPPTFCSMSCSTGYFVIGSPVRYCNAYDSSGGLWSGAPFYCGQCPAIPAPTNGSPACPVGTSQSATCAQTCNYGYNATGGFIGIRNCGINSGGNAGQWTGGDITATALVCSKMCPKLFAPANGNISGICTNTSNYGSMCKFKCQTGLQLVGFANTTCQSDGTWSNPTPICSPICPPLAAPTNGFNTGNCGPTTTNGAVCNQTCYNGYGARGGNGLITCTIATVGSWSSAPITCVQCPALPAPTLGTPACPATNVEGQWCNRTCQPGQLLPADASPANIQCINGVWTPASSFSCKFYCPAIPDPQFGDSTCDDSVTYGSICSVNCQSGYALASGVPGRVCVGSPTYAYNDTTNLCLPICPAVPQPQFGKINSGCIATQNPGASCNITCNAGSIPSGNTLRYCIGGAYNGTALTCTPQCPDIPLPLDGLATCSNTTVNNSLCVMTCQPGYNAVGNVVKKCVNGVWNDTAIQCKQCPAQSTPAFSSAAPCAAGPVGTLCTQTCWANATTIGYTTRVCNVNGQWNASQVMCNATCPQILPPNNGQNTCPSTTAIGSLCVQKCNANNDVSGDPVRKCQADGSWNGTALTCSPRCPTVSVPNGGFCWNTTVVGTICSISCKPGYITINPYNAICLATGNWNYTSNMQCVQCGAIANTSHSSPPCPATGTVGQQCFQSCDAGYSATGATNFTATCGSNGLWTAGAGFNGATQASSLACLVMCPQITQPYGALPMTCGPQLSGTCTMQCDTPLNGFSGSSVTRTCSAGSWNFAPPVCNSTCPSIQSLGAGQNAVDLSKCGQWSKDNNTICQIGCLPGWTQVGGDFARRCTLWASGGSWNGTTSVCAKFCPDTVPSNPAGLASNNCTMTLNASTPCSMTCLPGYTPMVGTTVVNVNQTFSCSGTSWTYLNGFGVATTFNCLRCPAAAAPANGTGSCAAGPVGTTCVQTCNPGFYSSESGKTRICSSNLRDYNGSVPTCTPVCPALSAPVNGSMNGACTNLPGVGSVCTFSCNAKFALYNGSAIRVCGGAGASAINAWNGTQPSCAPVCAADNIAGTDPVTACQQSFNGTVCYSRCLSSPTPYAYSGPSPRWCDAFNAAGPKWAPGDYACQTCPSYFVTNSNEGGCPATNISSQACTISCLTGYHLNPVADSPTRTCNLTLGMYNPNPQVCSSYCPALTTPANGRYLDSACNGTFSGGAQCRLTCNTNYSVWTGGIGCGSAPGNVYTMQCDTGNPVGSASGVWRQCSNPQCVLNCPPYTPPANASGPTCNATVDPITGNVTGNCNYTCRPGFRLVGVGSISCVTGQWVGGPICDPECPDVAMPGNGSTTSGCTKTINNGDTCVQACNPGYTLVGDATRYCQQGVWSGLAVQCGQCPPLAAPTGGSPTCPAAVAGTPCFQNCTYPYYVYLSGVLNRTCAVQYNNASSTAYPLVSWQPISPLQCTPLCPLVPSPRNGGPDCPPTTNPATKCAQTCNPGFTLLGTASRDCTNGNWTGTAVTCNSTCLALPAIVNGAPACTATTINGKVCPRYCKVGYAQVPALGNATCVADLDTAAWSPDTSSVTCNQCPAIPTPGNGTATNCQATTTNGATCTLACNAPWYVPSSAGPFTCQLAVGNGTWANNPSAFRCIPYCNDVAASTNSPAGCNGTQNAGTVCTTTCNGNAVQTGGNATRTCVNGNWTGLPIQCTLQCPAISSNANITNSCLASFAGAWCNQTCANGYAPAAFNGGNLNRQCLPTGVWTGSNLYCEVQCPAIATPVNGTLGCAATTDRNAMCTPSCVGGFELCGPPARRCQYDGNWSGGLQSCVACPALARPPGGNASCSIGNSGDVCYGGCNAGFQQSGTFGPITCGACSGSWSAPLPTCTPLCPQLDQPAGGNGGTCPATTVNNQPCTFDCNVGFTAIGSKTRYCSSVPDVPGTWTGTPLQCVSECPYLTAPFNGGPACNNTAVNHTMCNQTCLPNFKTLFGPQPRECIMQPGVNNGGAWTGAPILCIQCPTIPAPVGASTPSCPATPNDGDQCIMGCLGTYTPLGSATRTCQNGTWDGTPFTCNLNCPPIPAPQYGSVDCAATYQPDWCNQTCLPGMFLNGTANRKCNGGFGTWTGQQVTCIPQCPAILAPGNGSVFCNATTKNGQTCNQTCNFGYNNTGTGLVCNNGTWIGTQVTCIPECPATPNLGNGTGACPKTTVMGLTCTQACDVGYLLYPPLFTRTCVNGNWTAQGRCVRCEQINAPVGGGPDCPATPVNGDTCYQTCNAGYKRTGDPTARMCMNGVWNGTATSCAPECPLVPTPQYSSSAACQPTTSYGSFCNQACVGTYTPSGSLSRTCQSNGTWTGIALSCLPTCPAVGLNGVRTVTTCSSTTVDGTPCNQNCASGYAYLSGNFNRTCTNGTWSGQQLDCSIQCPTINPPNNGSVLCPATNAYGTFCNQTCAPGFFNNGTGRACMSTGVWSGRQVVCIPLCPALDQPYGGNNGGCAATTTVGAWCNQTCLAGRRLVGTANRQCINGQWTGVNVTCPIECPAISAAAHSSTGACAPTIDIGSGCYQPCCKWYRNLGVDNRTCQASGSWLGQPTNCIAECPTIPAPVNGGPTCFATINPGDKCQQTCNTGFLAVGDNTLFCQNGNWTGTPVTCIPQCPYIPAPFNGAGACNATTVSGTHCVQSCNAGTTVNGNFDRVCINGNWNGTRLTCSRCSDYTNCAQCTQSDPNCGWCGKTATCMAGDGNGAIGGTCPQYWVSPQSRIVTSSTTANSSVVPTYYQIYLRANQPLIVPVSVYTFRVPLDVYLLQDVSSSFGQDLPTLKQLAPTLIANLTAIVTSDSQFGVGAFIDKPNPEWATETDFVFRPYQTITTNTSAVIAQMNALYVTPGSGIDLPEAQLEGLLHAIQCPSVIGWRPNARHMVFLSTDAWFHSRGEGFLNLDYLSDDGRSVNQAEYVVQNNEDCVVQTYEDYPSAYQIKAACNKNNVIPIIALSDNGDPVQPQWQRLIDLIGFGGTTPITHDGSGMVNAIKVAYEAASSVILLTEATDTYNLLQTISPPQGYTNVSLDDYRVFQTTFQWDGTVIPPTTVVINAIGFGSLSIDVSYATCNCTGIPCPISGGLQCGGHGTCDCGLCNCFQGWSGADCSCNTNKTCSEFNFCSGRGTCQCGVCACDSGWGNSNCSCAAASCDATCVPPRGDCNCGICTCRSGFYAKNSIGGCDCSAAPCPQNCTYPNGQCDCGTCNCAPGFTGPNCNCTTAPCPNLCSGHGNCSCGTCQCAPGWSGDDCSCSQAPCADPTCGGHGTCVCGQCQCDALYSGSDCTCFNIPCLNNCNAPNGTCVCGQCVCNNYTSGADCSCDITKVCPSGPGGVCNGNGDCDCGICNCDFGFTGAACNCSLVCENDCSGHGTCNCGVCECQPGWSGTDCSCTNATCPNNCFNAEGHGECICGQCVCDSVHWAGSDCGCSTAPCPDNCFGNGQCVCGECQCNEGYTPPNCTCDASTTCPGPNNNCNGHGTCDCGCICTDGYSGNDCLCFEGPCLGTNGCSGHGNCTCDSCVCEPGYSGFDCSCHSGLACPTNDPAKNCSGHGTCDGCSNCICDTTYFGTPDCSCLNTPCTPDANCSGNGVCTCGQCVCNANWNGTSCECSLLPCAPDPTCGGHGHCSCGECICDQDWITTNASLPCGTCGGPSCQPPGPVAACPLLTTCDTCIAGNCRWCPSNSRCYAAPDLPAGSLCSTTVEGTTSCPTGAAAFFGNTVAVSGTAVGIAFLIVFVILAILALLKWLRDRRDYNEWFKASQDVAFTMADNPLHKSQFQTYENRLYEAHE